MDKLNKLIETLKIETKTDNIWQSELELVEKCEKSVHLAVFIEPYLTWILQGKKTIESRFSINKCAPYKKIKEGDIILLKKSGGPIYGIAQADSLWFYNLDPSSWKEIKDDFAIGICAQDPSFWEQREKASYATLIKLKNVRSTSPIIFPKKDRRGWVILSNQATTPLF